MRRVDADAVIPSVLPDGVNGRIGAGLDGYRRCSREDWTRAADALFSALPIGALLLAGDGRVIYCNGAFERMWQPEDDPCDPGAGEPPRPWRSLVGRLMTINRLGIDSAPGATGGSLGPVEIENADGRIVRCIGQFVREAEGDLPGWLWLCEDVTCERQSSARLRFLAEHDSLTGLYNRYRFQEELARLLAACERRRLRTALLIFDLDGFKEVNDTYGHGSGDDLLKRVSAAVSARVRRDEFLARLGGDEFAILAADVSVRKVRALATRITRAIAGVEFTVRNGVLRLSGSGGIAMFPAHAATADDLAARADEAMYRAKASGGGTWCIYGD